MTKKKPESNDINIDRELAKLRWKTRLRRLTAWVKNPLQRPRGTRRLILTRLLSLRALAICLLSITVVGQLGLAPIPGMPLDDTTVSSATDDARDLLANDTQPAATSSPGDRTRDADSATTDEYSEKSTEGGAESLDREAIEDAVHAEINERREEHDLDPLGSNPQLQTIAREHSADMAENDYFSHTAPDGSDFEDRYQEHGYSCKVPTTGNEYATGGENIAYTYAFEEVTGSDGITRYYDSEDELAGGLVNQWMKSPGHRHNILRPYWRTEGIGIAIIEEDGNTKVYATQNFC